MADTRTAVRGWVEVVPSDGKVNCKFEFDLPDNEEFFVLLPKPVALPGNLSEALRLEYRQAGEPERCFVLSYGEVYSISRRYRADTAGMDLRLDEVADFMRTALGWKPAGNPRLVFWLPDEEK